jgi:hypothetical protein
MNVSDATIGSIVEFWKTLMDSDFWKDAIDVELVCNEQCIYSIMCIKAGNRKKIGKWCLYYCEKFIELLQKEGK